MSVASGRRCIPVTSTLSRACPRVPGAPMAAMRSPAMARSACMRPRALTTVPPVSISSNIRKAAAQPPSTGRSIPVICRARAEARNSVASAAVVSTPVLPIGPVPRDVDQNVDHPSEPVPDRHDRFLDGGFVRHVAAEDLRVETQVAAFPGDRACCIRVAAPEAPDAPPSRRRRARWPSRPERAAPRTTRPSADRTGPCDRCRMLVHAGIATWRASGVDTGAARSRDGGARGRIDRPGFPG